MRPHLARRFRGSNGATRCVAQPRAIRPHAAQRKNVGRTRYEGNFRQNNRSESSATRSAHAAAPKHQSTCCAVVTNLLATEHTLRRGSNTSARVARTEPTTT